MNDHTIALSGLSDTDAAMFEAALGSLPTHPWKLVDTPPARLMVVDVDTVWGHMDWLRAVGSGQTVVAYSNDARAHRDGLALDKPLRTRDLADMLDSLAAEEGDGMSAALAPPPAAAPASPTPPPAPTTATDDPFAASEFIAPEMPVESESDADTVDPAPDHDVPSPDTPLGVCLIRGQLEHAVELEHDGVRLRLDPERGGYTGSATLKPLAPLLDQPISSVRALDADDVASMRQEAAIPMTRLLWFAALCATPGSLSPDLDPHATYRLTRWPQIEREFPRHFRIATAMMKGPGTLGDIASAANAPVGDVADFINAYSMAGHVSASITPDTDAPVEADGKRMFSRLRRSLSRGGA